MAAQGHTHHGSARIEHTLEAVAAEIQRSAMPSRYSVPFQLSMGADLALHHPSDGLHRAFSLVGHSSELYEVWLQSFLRWNRVGDCMMQKLLYVQELALDVHSQGVVQRQVQDLRREEWFMACPLHCMVSAQRHTSLSSTSPYKNVWQLGTCTKG